MKNQSGSTILVILLIVFTFPLWIGLLGGLIGLVFGIGGAIIGIIAAIIGAIAAIIGWLFGLVDWTISDGVNIHFPFMSFNTFIFIVLIVALLFTVRSRNRQATK